VGAFAHQAAYLALALALLFFLFLRNTAHPLLAFMGVDPAIIPPALGYLDAISWGTPGLCGFLLLRMVSEGLSNTRAVMYFSSLGLAINIPANYALMFGEFGFPRMEVVGCGYASALTQWLQFAGFLAYVFVKPRYRKIGLLRLPAPPRWPDITRILHLGLPIGGSVFIEGSLFASAALLMGSLGTTTTAAHQAAINFSGLAFMIPLGVGMAITIRVGNALGRNDPAGARRAGLAGFAIVLVTQLASASFMLLYPEAVVAIYTDDPGVRAVAVELLFLAAIFQLPDGFQAAGAGALRGLKDTRIPMLFTVIAYWLVGLPLGYSLGIHLGYGAEGMWVGLIGGLSIAAILMIGRFLRLSAAGRLHADQLQRQQHER
jgi:MATE family multidrug resistance protein